ncbi:uncharacterized protein PG986_010359 [Apiospora aurea]|uniref:Uncharacterized protein n=1 Tax=Apiospora aurea TaxID=335848 RepID=A0ABR1Q209_9PEZI
MGVTHATEYTGKYRGVLVEAGNAAFGAPQSVPKKKMKGLGAQTFWVFLLPVSPSMPNKHNQAKISRFSKPSPA